MKMIPCPEPGDKVILGEFKVTGNDGNTTTFPEAEVEIAETTADMDPPIFSTPSEDWQISFKDEDGDIQYVNVKWDNIKKVWRDDL